MAKRLFFFMVIVPMMNLSMGQLKKANSAPDIISEYKEKIFTSLISQNTRKKFSIDEIDIPPSPELVARKLLVRGKKYYRDMEFSPKEQYEVFKLAQMVKKRDLSDPNEFVFITRVAEEKGYKKNKNSKNLSA